MSDAGHPAPLDVRWKHQVSVRLLLLAGCVAAITLPWIRVPHLLMESAAGPILTDFALSVGFLLFRLRQKVWFGAACWRAISLALGAGIVSFLILVALATEASRETVAFLLFWSWLAVPPVALFVLLPDEREGPINGSLHEGESGGRL